MISQATRKIVESNVMNYDEAYQVMEEIMKGQASDLEKTAFLTALAARTSSRETPEEIAGLAAAMRDNALPFERDGDVLEIVGTGGDHASSFNISTTSAIVAAAAGIKVAKHGNRAASSLCGTADCLEALGIKISLEPEECLRFLDETGMCFFFAQKYHPSMKHVGAIRKALGFPTVFNILGPLTNPARPSRQLLGVYDESLIEPMADALSCLGVEKGMVVYGMDKLDEISLSSETKICEFSKDGRKIYKINPEQFGFERCAKEDLIGGNPEENAQITLNILSGAKGAKRDAVLLNAGAALYLADKADSIEEGIELAKELIDSKKALDTLNSMIDLSRRLQA